MLKDLGVAVPIASVIVTGVAALLGVLGYQNRRAKQSGIRSAFADAIALLADEKVERRLAGAILLRRFFDPSSELGVRDMMFRRRAPYAKEARDVLAAVLRGVSSGDFQKLLADGLRHAQTLEDADLQRTNLQNAYLAPMGAAGTLKKADFYRAELSGASLREARAQEAQFYQARLQDTIFKGADLRNANFFEADLTGANFADALLEGASFKGARNIPVELIGRLDRDLKYCCDVPAPGPAKREPESQHVFLSAPSVRTPAQDSIYERIGELLSRDGLVVDTLPPQEYPSSGVLAEIGRRLARCAGAIVLGLQRDGSDQDVLPVGATPWTHLEAGMAYGQGLPLLIMREPGVCAGAFDDAVNGHRTYVVEVGAAWNGPQMRAAIAPWLDDISKGGRNGSADS
jgi:hypothetical protein